MSSTEHLKTHLALAKRIAEEIEQHRTAMSTLAGQRAAALSNAVLASSRTTVAAEIGMSTAALYELLHRHQLPTGTLKETGMFPTRYTVQLTAEQAAALTDASHDLAANNRRPTDLGGGRVQLTQPAVDHLMTLDAETTDFAIEQADNGRLLMWVGGSEYEVREA